MLTSNLQSERNAAESLSAFIFMKQEETDGWTAKRIRSGSETFCLNYVNSFVYLRLIYSNVFSHFFSLYNVTELKIICISILIKTCRRRSVMFLYQLLFILNKHYSHWQKGYWKNKHFSYHVCNKISSTKMTSPFGSHSMFLFPTCHLFAYYTSMYRTFGPWLSQLAHSLPPPPPPPSSQGHYICRAFISLLLLQTREAFAKEGQPGVGYCQKQRGLSDLKSSIRICPQDCTNICTSESTCE